MPFAKKTVSFSKHATNVFFHILTQCNLKCRHCYINPRQHGRKALPAEVVEKWLAAFSHASAAANLVLLGGEPTLHPELSRIIKISRHMGFGSVTVDTNGYLFHDILEKVTPQEVDVFSFSLDGASPTTNDRIRGKGSFARCLSGMDKAARAGFETSMIYTVSSLNIYELEKLYGLVKDLPVHQVFIQVIGLRGKSAGPASDKLQVTPETWGTIVPGVAEQLAGAGKKVIYPKVYLKTDEIFECAGRVASNWFIFPNGRVYQCPLCEDHPLHGHCFENNQLKETSGITETDLFGLEIPEGCVMNKLIQPDNISYQPDGRPEYRIACCLLKEEVTPE